jgi:LysM repeat protein
LELLSQANCLLSPSIPPGSILYVPPQPTQTPIPCGPPAGWIIYIVKQQDTLFHISTLYRTTVPQLQAANCLGNSTLIITGQSLYVPNVVVITPTKSITPTKTTTTPTVPGLTLVKASITSSYNSIGDVISYTYNLKNTGTAILSGPFTVSDDKTTVTCPLTASLAPNASIDCTASYTVTQNDLDAGSVINTASGHANSEGITVNSNQDIVTVIANQLPQLTLDKTSITNSYVLAGEQLVYNYNLTNTGNVTLVGPFTVNDDKTTVSCPATASLAPNASIDCSSTYIVIQDDVDNLFVSNTATGQAFFAGSAVISNSDTVIVNSTQPQGSILNIDPIKISFRFHLNLNNGGAFIC